MHLFKPGTYCVPFFNPLPQIVSCLAFLAPLDSVQMCPLQRPLSAWQKAIHQSALYTVDTFFLNFCPMRCICLPPPSLALESVDSVKAGTFLARYWIPGALSNAWAQEGAKWLSLHKAQSQLPQASLYGPGSGFRNDQLVLWKAGEIDGALLGFELQTSLPIPLSSPLPPLPVPPPSPPLPYTLCLPISATCCLARGAGQLHAPHQPEPHVKRGAQSVSEDSKQWPATRK